MDMGQTSERGDRRPARRRAVAAKPAAALRYGPLQDCIGFHLRRAQDASFNAFRRRVGDPGLSPGRFALLVLIGANPGINQTTLSRATGRDKSTLTPALRDLVRRGWVRRERPRGDRRAYALRLSAVGREHLRLFDAHAGQHDRELDAIVGARRKAEFIGLLERIVAELDRRGGASRRHACVAEDPD